MTKEKRKGYNPIGIDVSKLRLDVFILSSKKYEQFENNATGIKQLIRRVKKFSSVLVVMEATGGYERAAAQALTKSKIETAVVNPRQVRDYAKATGRLAKTDKIDAEVIALFGQHMNPEANVNCDENQLELSSLSARRSQLVGMIVMERNRLEQTDKHALKSIEAHIIFLEKSLEDINKLLGQIIEAVPEYQEKNKLLQSVKGIGSVVAANLIADLPELGELTDREISALVGIAPLNKDSGKMRGKRCIWGGRASVRRTLYMATLVATRFNKKIKAFYTKLCVAGKLKKIALIACMHKLLIIINAMMQKKEAWKEQPCR